MPQRQAVVRGDVTGARHYRDAEEVHVGEDVAGHRFPFCVLSLRAPHRLIVVLPLRNRLRVLHRRQSRYALQHSIITGTALVTCCQGVSYGPELATASVRSTNVTFDSRGWRTACLVLRNAHGRRAPPPPPNPRAAKARQICAVTRCFAPCRDVLGSSQCVIVDALGVDKPVRCCVSRLFPSRVLCVHR